VERLIFAIAIERHNRGRVNGKLKYLIMNSLLKLIPSAAGTITLKKPSPFAVSFPLSWWLFSQMMSALFNLAS